MTEGDFLVVRRTLGLTWRMLARELGVSERNLRRFRRGEAPTPRTVQLACLGLICRETHQRTGLTTTIDPRLTLPGRLRRAKAVTREGATP